MDFSKSIGMGNVPTNAIKSIKEWLYGIEDVEVLTCWHEEFEVHCTVAVTEKGSFDMPVKRILGLRTFAMGKSWRISQDFSKVLK